MPYEIKKIRNGLWVKINKETGKVKSHHSSKAKALASIRAAHVTENNSIKLKDIVAELNLDYKLK